MLCLYTNNNRYICMMKRDHAGGHALMAYLQIKGLRI